MTRMAGCGEWAIELAKAFGLDPGNTRSMTLNVSTDSVVTVIAEIYVDKENTNVLEIIKKVAWKEAERIKDVTSIQDEYEQFVSISQKEENK